MQQLHLYKVCRMPPEALEAWDLNDIEPEVVYGPASLDACLVLYGHHLASSLNEYFLADDKGESC